MPSGFSLGPQNLAVAERFSLGTSPVDWLGFSLDPETVSAVLRNGEVPGRPQRHGTEGLQCLKEHASLEVQRAIDVQPVRFAASKCVPIKGQPQKHSKREENARWCFSSCHPDEIDGDKIWYCSNSWSKGSVNFQDTPFILQCRVRASHFSW